MAGWRIVSWDRAAGCGTCASGVGSLSFDASIALVDDFVVGEEVEVTLRAAGATYEITRIEPVGFRAPFAAAPGALADEVARIYWAVAGRSARLAGVDDDFVRILVENDSYRPMRALVFGGPVLVQMPVEIDAIGMIHAFIPADVGRAAPELTRHWPLIPADCTVFRIDPERFGDAAAYVVARTLALVEG